MGAGYGSLLLYESLTNMELGIGAATVLDRHVLELQFVHGDVRDLIAPVGWRRRNDDLAARLLKGQRRAGRQKPDRLQLRLEAAEDQLRAADELPEVDLVSTLRESPGAACSLHLAGGQPAVDGGIAIAFSQRPVVCRGSTASEARCHWA